MIYAIRERTKVGPSRHSCGTSEVCSVDDMAQAPAAMGIGAGEEACTLGMLCISTSPPELLTSLLAGCSTFSLFSLLLPLADTGPKVGTSSGVASSTGLGFGGAVHRWISHETPVKVLSWKLPLAHLRQGFPERSRARRPALMAPWFALGPSRWAFAREGSRVPSSLRGY